MSQKLSLLVLEDSEDDARLLVRKLIKDGSYEPAFERVESLEGLREALDRKRWDLIVSDHSMPRFSALSALKELKERQLDIPLIIVSGTIEPTHAIAAMKAGASDFIMKDDLTRLIPAIERELREARSRSEKRSTEEKFPQTQKMESIGRLAGGVAHDFNNILTAIMGYAAMLARSLPKGTTESEDVGEILKAADRAAALTRQLLAFSRRQALQMTVVDFNAEFVELEKMLRRMIGEDIAWKTSLAADLGRIKADPGQIQQVVMNLVVNARDAMPRGGTLTVKSENVSLQEPRSEGGFVIPPGSYAVIAVSDTGVGIDESVRPHLFEPFFTTKEKGKGTGLGLAVIFGIVKQTGGFITVDSALGKGATFRVYLPRTEEAAGAKAEHAVPRSDTGTETVLLVDDEEAVRALMRRVLRQHGYATLEAGSGEEALKLAKANAGTLHLLLTDMVLPDINGMELAQRLRAVHPEAKVVLLSGYLDKDLGSFVIDEKTPFLQKPFSPLALARMVREVLDSSPGAPKPPA